MGHASAMTRRSKQGAPRVTSSVPGDRGAARADLAAFWPACDA
jgi:hypothetical protein